MKNVIFFVHGIGRHGKGWSQAPDGPVVALNEAMKQYACFQGKSLSDFVDPVEILYDDLFDLVLSKWAQLAEDLGPVGGNIDWIGKVQSLLTGVGDNKNEYADYGGDVLLYGGFDLVARAVRLRVASVFAGEVLQRHLKAQNLEGQFPKFGIVAHSMGTAVAHDALWTLATADFLKDKSTLATSRAITKAPELIASTTLSDDQRDHFEKVETGTRDHPDRPMPFPVNTLLLVSNVIPLISRVNGDYLSSMHDNLLQCAAFRDVNNRFDPICNVKRFAVGNRTNGKRIDVDHIHEKNVHGFGHYLSNPLVHMPLLVRMTDVVTPDDIDKSKKLAEEGWHGLGEALQAELREKLEAMIGVGDIQDLMAKFKALKELV
ncbi:MAG: hypothetical protein HY067_13770 [Betaproteobacteria bacterium]|nr:hypothetical protein [Betaproteobacteria bacterium]